MTLFKSQFPHPRRFQSPWFVAQSGWERVYKARKVTLSLLKLLAVLCFLSSFILHGLYRFLEKEEFSSDQMLISKVTELDGLCCCLVLLSGPRPHFFLEIIIFLHLTTWSWVNFFCILRLCLKIPLTYIMKIHFNHY